MSPHLRELAGGEAREGVSLALHAIIGGLPQRDARDLAAALVPSHPLLRYGLLESGNDAVHAARPFSVPLRVATFLSGDDTIDGAVLRAGGAIRVDEEPHFDDAQLAFVKHLAQTISATPPLMVMVDGPEGAGKRTAAAVAALVNGRRMIQIDATRLATLAELEQSLVALRRECLLNDALPLIANIDDLTTFSNEGRRGRLHSLARLLDETPIPVVVTSRVAGLDLGTQRSVLRLSMPVADVSARLVLWKANIGERPDVDLDLLSMRYRLGPGGIKRAVSIARVLSNGSTPTARDLVQGVRNGIAEQLAVLC